MTNMNPVQWQVVLVVNDGYETWKQPIDGEVFDTEQEADSRAAELDQCRNFPGEYHTTRAV